MRQLFHPRTTRFVRPLCWSLVNTTGSECKGTCRFASSLESDPHLRRALKRLSRELLPPPRRAAKPLFPQVAALQMPAIVPGKKVDVDQPNVRFTGPTDDGSSVSEWATTDRIEEDDDTASSLIHVPLPQLDLRSISGRYENRSPRQKRFAAHLQSALESALMRYSKNPSSPAASVEIVHVHAERNIHSATVWWQYDDEVASGQDHDSSMRRSSTSDATLNLQKNRRNHQRYSTVAEAKAAAWLEKHAQALRFEVTSQLRLSRSPRIGFRRAVAGMLSEGQ
jgi:ribosome-binding factor A